MSAAKHTAIGSVRFLDRVAAWRASRGGAAGEFVQEPVPRTIGGIARGEDWISGLFVAAGHSVDAPGTQPWDVASPSLGFSNALHGFEWLDDLAAVGNQEARLCAQDWTASWIRRYGRGSGPGWTPALAGRRLQRLLHHALMLLRSATPKDAANLRMAFAVHARYLARRSPAAPPGLPRIEALVALATASCLLEGLGLFTNRAHRGLVDECLREIGTDGSVATRNPETLLAMLTRLTWAQAALTGAGQVPDPALGKAAARLGRTLRALRHADGGLARFHGGGRGASGLLDAALAEIGRKPKPPEGSVMGYARLSRGRTTMVVDAAPPPSKAASAGAHASTLAFELTSGRRPLIVNCGAGDDFGDEWRRAGRATPSHSTLCLDGASSAVLAPLRKDGAEWLGAAPRRVPVEAGRRDGGLTLEAGHDGYVAQYGLTHARTFALSLDGRHLAGDDFLVALDQRAKTRFDAALAAGRPAGVPFKIHFHIHPDVDVAMNRSGQAVSMALRSGEIWVLRFEGEARLSVEPSVYLQAGLRHPRATNQVVLSGLASEYTTRLRWSLANAQDTGPLVRDLVEDALTEH